MGARFLIVNGDGLRASKVLLNWRVRLVNRDSDEKEVKVSK